MRRCQSARNLSGGIRINSHPRHRTHDGEQRNVSGSASCYPFSQRQREHWPTFRFHGMVDYLLQDSTVVSKTSQKMAFGIILIMSSISPVMSFVANADWDFDKVDQDPKDLYDLILKLYQWRSVNEVDERYGRWYPVQMFRKLGLYGSIEKFHHKVLFLRREMKGHGVDLSDREATKIVVNALRAQKAPMLYDYLSQRLVAGDLTWKELMEELATKCAWGGESDSGDFKGCVILVSCEQASSNLGFIYGLAASHGQCRHCRRHSAMKFGHLTATRMTVKRS